MIRLILILSWMTLVRTCEIPMSLVWRCADRAVRYHKNCVTPRDIHKIVRLRSTTLSRPTLLRDGVMFQKLFEDCDLNKDKCITRLEADQADACVRDCKWRQAWVDTFCNL